MVGLERRVRELWIPGLRDTDARTRFASCLARALDELSRLRRGALPPEARRGPGPPFNPFAEAKRVAPADRWEAVWLAFLATHMGWDRPDSCGVLYAGLSGAPRWTWPAVSEDGGESFEQWVRHSWPALTRFSPFGNYRKYMTHRPTAPVSCQGERKP